MYVAVKGGERAIENAHAWLAEERRGDTAVAENMLLVAAICADMRRHVFDHAEDRHLELVRPYDFLGLADKQIL